MLLFLTLIICHVYESTFNLQHPIDNRLMSSNKEKKPNERDSVHSSSALVADVTGMSEMEMLFNVLNSDAVREHVLGFKDCATFKRQLPDDNLKMMYLRSKGIQFSDDNDSNIICIEWENDLVIPSLNWKFINAFPSTLELLIGDCFVESDTGDEIDKKMNIIATNHKELIALNTSVSGISVKIEEENKDTARNYDRGQSDDIKTMFEILTSPQDRNFLLGFTCYAEFDEVCPSTNDKLNFWRNFLAVEAEEGAMQFTFYDGFVVDIDWCDSSKHNGAPINFAALRKLEHLRYLSLRGLGIEITMDDLSNLPQSVQYLEISDNKWDSQMQLSMLPSGIRSFRAQNMAGLGGVLCYLDILSIGPSHLADLHELHLSGDAVQTSSVPADQYRILPIDYPNHVIVLWSEKTDDDVMMVYMALLNEVALSQQFGDLAS